MMTREELRDELAMLMGGRVAEEIIAGDISTGAGNDIERATKIARQMVTEHGMSDAIGPRTLGQKQGEVFLGRDWASTPDYSEAVAFEIDQEISRLIDEAHDVALEILSAAPGAARRARGPAAARRRRWIATRSRRSSRPSRSARPARRRSAAPASPCRGPRCSPIPTRRDRSAGEGTTAMTDRWATFDCYGTLIDWDGGVRRALVKVWPDRERAIGCSSATTTWSRASRPGGTSPTGRCSGRRSARSPRRRTLELAPGDDDALADSLPSWRPFPEVHGRARRAPRSRLAARDPVEHRPRLLDRLAEDDRRRGGSPDHGGRGGSYKPAYGHWDTFFRTTLGRPRAPRARRGIAVSRRRAVRAARAPVRLDQPVGRVERSPARGRAANLGALPDHPRRVGSPVASARWICSGHPTRSTPRRSRKAYA